MEMLVAVDGELRPGVVTDVDIEEGGADVYDLEVTPTHSYVAAGVLVHNSVYRFRGADYRNILQFEQAFPDVTTVVLDQNYRSTQNILDAANAVIANNEARKPKNLWTDAGAGDRIVRYHAEDEGDEATFVTSSAARLRQDDAFNWRDIAVLYRTNAQSRVIEEAMMRLGVPYKVVGGTRFYDRREIKDAMSYLRAVVNPADEVSIKRVLNIPKRGVGDASIAKIDAYAAAHGVGFLEALRMAGDAGVTGPAVRGIDAFVTLIDRLHALADEARRAGQPRRPAAGGAGGVGLPRRAGSRRHRRVGRTVGEPGRARGLGPRVHGARRVPRAGRARGRHRPARRRRPDRADDAPQRQGSRVPGGVPDRGRRGRLPPRASADRARRAGRGAAAGLRRHHPGSPTALRHARVEPQPVRHDAVQPAVAVPRRDPGRAGRVPGQRQRPQRLRPPEPAVAILVERPAAVPPPPGQRRRRRRARCSRAVRGTSRAGGRGRACGPVDRRHRRPARPTTSGCGSATTSMHPSFGEGVIIDLRGHGDSTEATVNFAGVGTKHLALAWAPLTKR